VRALWDTLLVKSSSDFPSRRALVAAGFLSIPVVGVVDWLTGSELSFSFFYLLPIFLVSWYGGFHASLSASLFAAFTWLLADDLAGRRYSEAWIPYWNMSVRFGIFLVTGVLLARLVEQQRRRRLLEQMFFHDLLNLAGSLRGFAELLQDENIPDRQGVAGLLEQTADRVIEEIEAQRLLTAAESGEIELQLEVTSGKLLLQTLASIYRFHPTAASRSIVLGECCDGMLVTDQTLLIRVLGNLLKNALEATPSGGEVALSCRQAERGLVFDVHNAGMIPDAIRGRMFRGGSTKGEGRGFGLWSSLLLVKALSGEIIVESSRGTGTTLSVSLPSLDH